MFLGLPGYIRRTVAAEQARLVHADVAADDAAAHLALGRILRRRDLNAKRPNMARRDIRTRLAA